MINRKDKKIAHRFFYVKCLEIILNYRDLNSLFFTISVLPESNARNLPE